MSRILNNLGSTALTAIAIAGLVFTACVPLPWQYQAILGCLLIISSSLLSKISKSPVTTITLTIVSVLCTARYTQWRWASTFRYLSNNGWHVDVWGLIFGLLLLSAEAYAALILLLGFFQTARPLMRRPIPMPQDDAEWPSIDVFIPTYNEPLEVVRPTVLAAMAIDWPADRLRVHLLDDGKRAEFKAFAEECSVSYITRPSNAHAKAGNINHALEQTTGEYVAIFDCDHIATRSFLQMTIGWFLKDRRLGMLQTPHHFYSPDPFERNLNVFRRVPNEGLLFYGIVQQGSDLWNATFFCGSCAVLRRTALDEIGGIAVETVTEDAHTSLRMQRRGWNTAFIGVPQAAGLATGSLSAHIGQRIRWARGMVQILRTECPLFVSGLKFSQRLCYFNSTVHFLYALPRLIFLTAPLVYLLFGKSNLYGSLWEILAYAMPHLVIASMTNSRVQGSHRHSFWNEVYETVLAPYILLPTTFALINPKWGKFNVTSKGSVVDESFFDIKVARPYLFLIGLNVIGLAMAVPKYLSHGDPTGVLLINVIWAVLNTLLLGTTVAVATESRQRRASVRLKSNVPAQIVLESGEIHLAKVIDISEGGVALQVQRTVNLQPDAGAEVLIQHADEEYRFKTEVVAAEQKKVRLRFASSDIDHYQAITRVIYSRADSWLSWTEDQLPDNVFSSLFRILSIGVYGLAILPVALFRRPRKEADSAPPRIEKVAPAPGPVLSGIVLLVALGLHPGAAKAKTPDRQPSSTQVRNSVGPSFHDRQDLTHLGQSNAITMHGDDASASLVVAVESTKIVTEASLHIQYRASAAAVGSSVEVALNGTSIASFAPQPGGDEGGISVANVSIPYDLLVHENTFTFHLHSKCNAPCTANDSLASWVRIELPTELETSGLVLTLPNSLAGLPAPFFDSSYQRTVELPVAFGEQPDTNLLKAAGVVSSWFGILADYRGLHSPVSTGNLPRGNVILFATSNSALVGNLQLSVSGPGIAIRDNPSDPYGKVLVVSGSDSGQVLTAAQALVLGKFDRAADEAKIRAFNLPNARVAYDAPKWFPTGQLVNIAEPSTSGQLRASGGNPARVYFRLGPDLDFGSSESVALTLSYHLSRIPAGVRPELQISLNGVFIAARSIDPTAESETIAIPSSLLYASNTLLLDLKLPQEDSATQSMGGPELVINRTSVLDLRRVTHNVRMPRLDLFASSGFPFTKYADLSRTAVILPSHFTASELSTYLDALAFFGAQTGCPALRVEVITDATSLEGHGKDVLLIGSGEDQPLFSHLTGSMPVLPDAGQFRMVDAQGFWDRLSRSDWMSMDALWHRITTRNSKSDDQQASEVSNLLAADSRPYFALAQFPRPISGTQRTVVSLATATPDTGDLFVPKLSAAARNGKIQGNLSLLDADGFHTYSIRTHPYYLSDSDWNATTRYWMRYHLLIIPVIVFICALILGRSWNEFLEKRAKQRLYTEVA